LLAARSLRKEERALAFLPEQAFSKELLAAQERLQLLREKIRHQRVSLGLPIDQDVHGRSPTPEPSPTSTHLNVVALLPQHLGWGSAALTQVLRQTTTKPITYSDSAIEPTTGPVANANYSPGEGVLLRLRTPEMEFVRLYPDLAVAILKEEQAAPARVWLLLQHLDRQGCGWVELPEAKRYLTEEPARVCSWRQLRNLLAQGEGVFWDRDNGRIWLRSVTRVAASLNLSKLTGKSVSLPVSVLRQRIGTVRAHFYASFHSGRTGQGDGVKPIARATLQKISNVSRASQQNYERRAGVRRQANFALASQPTADTEQERAWQRGPALFHFTDHKGKHGAAGQRYLAWQLPNHYVGPHRHNNGGRQRRINRDLKDLFKKGITGNNKRVVERGVQRFYGDGRLAAQAYHRAKIADVFWAGESARNGRCQLWYVLPGQAG
jgi:hypothetical protein